MYKYLLIPIIACCFFDCGKKVIESNCCTDPPLTYVENNVVTFVPNLFTPNSDGVNDLFGPLTNFGVTSYNLKVVNPKKTLFEGTGDINVGMEAGFWNGNFEGSKVEGIFGWELTIETINEETFDFFGQVCVLPNPEKFCLRFANLCITSEQFDGVSFNENVSNGENLCL